MLDNFVFSPETGTFELNVTWEKPSLNYSKISAYGVSYQVNEDKVVMVSTVRYRFVLPSSTETIVFVCSYTHFFIDVVQ